MHCKGYRVEKAADLIPTPVSYTHLHLTPEEMSRVDDAVRASLALNPMGNIQRLPPIIRSQAAYAPPEVVDGKPPLYS